MIEPLSKRVNDLGWHIQIHMKGEQIAGIEELLLRVPSPIVFDHLGRLAQPNALDNPRIVPPTPLFYRREDGGLDAETGRFRLR
jgi:hypothetical protein